MNIFLIQQRQQRIPLAELSGEVRQRLGKPLRRASPLTQLAVVGALSCLPEPLSGQRLALLWQSTYGPRAETLALLAEICTGAGEPLPYDFLASQPAIAAAQLKPLLPGLETAHHLPLDDETQTQWSLMLTLAQHWLSEGRFAQVLCAHLDVSHEIASGDWLLLSGGGGDKALATLCPDNGTNSKFASEVSSDDRNFPARLDTLLTHPAGSGHRLRLQSPALPKLAVEFAR